MDGHESERTLARSLRALAEDDEQLQTSSTVGMRLLAEVHRIGQARRRRMTVLSLGAVAAAAVAAILISAGPRRLLDELRGTLPTAAQIQQLQPPVVTRELVTEFFPLRYGNVPARSGYVVRMQVPREALASFVGAAAVESNGGGSARVLADVFIGDDGLARAVRFVQVVSDRGPADAGLHGQEQTP
jgi:hypothetical protein